MGCVDSFSISPGFLCPDPTFYPVCGCDNKTYRNDCEARQRYGVRTVTDGSCSGYEIDIIPTYSAYQINFSIVQSNPNFSRLFIVDIYGRLWFQKEITADYAVRFPIDIYFLPAGPYILYVYDTKGTYRYKKFVKTY